MILEYSPTISRLRLPFRHLDKKCQGEELNLYGPSNTSELAIKS